MADHLSLTGLRALVVEDEYFVAADLKRILKQQGAELVMLSGSVDDAMAKFKDDEFDFGLLNINIRGKMTFLVADEFRRRSVPFAFVSGYDKNKIPPRFEAVPNWGKPYDDRQIVDGIRKLWTRDDAVLTS